MVKPNPPGSLGSYLRALRERKNVSLEEIAQATRVGVRQLQALESDDASSLPAPVFVRGFIRAYCHFLGESADEALARMPSAPGIEPPRARPVPRTGTATPSWVGSPAFISLVLLAIFGGGLLALNRVVAPVPPSARPAPVPTPTQPAPAATAPAASARSEGDAPAPAGAGAQHLVLSAIEPAWIRIQADDGKGIEELLEPGATREWTAQKRFVLTVGNAGGIALTLNGRRLPSLGGRGVVIRGLELPLTDNTPAS
jgi:cytoskeleton protein RodZ